MGCGSAEDTGANQERAAAITPALPWKKDARARHQAGGGLVGGRGGDKSQKASVGKRLSVEDKRIKIYISH